MTTTSVRPRVSRSTISCGSTASMMRSTATRPVWPRSGARKIATLAAAPAFSTRSPMRTISPTTVTVGLSGGPVAALRHRRVRREAVDERAVAAVGLAAANWAAAGEGEGEERERGKPDHGSSPQRIIADVDCSIWSAARDDLGVHLIGALRGDQVGDLGHGFDIGLLEIALLQVAVAVGVGLAVLRRAGGRRLEEEVVADRLQAGLVDEARQRELAEHGRRGRCRRRSPTPGPAH